MDLKTEKYYGIVYQIRNPINGKVYIGQTIQSLKKRKKDHRSGIKKFPALAIYRAFVKYGFDSFEWSILFYATNKAELDEAEKQIIAVKKSMSPKYGYNMTFGGEGGSHPPEIRKQISKSLKGRIFSEETRRRLSDALKGKYIGKKASFWGKKHSSETKLKMGQAQTGSKNHNFGRKASEETRRRMGESKRGILHWNHKPVLCIETGLQYISAIEARDKTGIDNSSIIKCCKGIRKNAGGFTWQYI